jgi:hypothetical protein
MLELSHLFFFWAISLHLLVESKKPNNRFDLSNPLARNLLEQQSKLRAKPYGHGFAGQANVRRTLRAEEYKAYKYNLTMHITMFIMYA